MSIWKDDLNKRKNNIRALFTDPKTRPIVFLMSGLMVGMVVVGYMSMGSAKNDSGVDAAATIATAPADVVSDPSARSSTAHQALQQEANRRALEDARARQMSSLPTLMGNDGISDPLTLPSLPTAEQPQQPTEAPTITLPPPAPVYTPPPSMYQGSVAEAPQVPAAKPKADEKVTEQVMGYLSLWGPDNPSQQEFSFAGTAKPEEQTQAQGQDPYALAQAQQMANQQPSQVQEKTIRFVRAGTVIPARMITPLNSDNPGPVLAEVTSGTLRGARLMGTMRTQKNAILVTFSTISKPGWPDTYPVSAVGMNNDGYTGMATDVNKHYLQRYASMLGGAFLSGYGEGLSQQGSTTIITDGGAVVNTQDELTTAQIRDKGYGQVASSIGQELQTSANRDVTVQIRPKNGQPYDFQVLFLESF